VATVPGVLAELAAAVRKGKVDPVDLVDESLRRIDASHATLNAVTALRADEARADAKAAGRTGPLAGLPLLVKDMARCAGMRTTFGSPLYADAPIDTIDDIVVARLKAAGAIVVGRSNTPAFGHTAVTSNQLYGTTHNPWNPERSPAGSSGGSAAALIAGLVPLATSSDGGGSVRIPASCCGLVGYKPTMGAIGRNIVPRWISLSTQGATGRSVADVVLEASVTMGPAVGDLLSLPAGSVSVDPVRPVRVLACRSFRADVDAVIEAALDEALADLAKDGFPVERVTPPFDASVAVGWYTVSTADLAQSMMGYRDQWDSFEPGLRGQLEHGETVTTFDYIAAQRHRYELAAQVDELLGTDAVLVVPTNNATSWPADGPMPTSAGAIENDLSIAVNTVDLNYSGHPGVSVPLGYDQYGVPFGLQIVGPRFADGLALGLAAAMERLRPWPTVAPGYEPYPVS
jgi:Asp-tRNA(Asn)/Glu-tRNA(Gln) amidotransferase A subunit family amidase